MKKLELEQIIETIVRKKLNENSSDNLFSFIANNAKQFDVKSTYYNKRSSKLYKIKEQLTSIFSELKNEININELSFKYDLLQDKILNIQIISKNKNDINIIANKIKKSTNWETVIKEFLTVEIDLDK